MPAARKPKTVAVDAENVPPANENIPVKTAAVKAPISAEPQPKQRAGKKKQPLKEVQEAAPTPVAEQVKEAEDISSKTTIREQKPKKAQKAKPKQEEQEEAEQDDKEEAEQEQPKAEDKDTKISALQEQVAMLTAQLNAIQIKKEGKPNKANNKTNRPKRPVTSFFAYCNEQRERIQTKNPELSLTEVSKLLSEQWAKLSAKQKEPYAEIAQKDKERYARQMEIWNKKQQKEQMSQKALEEYQKHKEVEVALEFYRKHQQELKEQEEKKLAAKEAARLKRLAKKQAAAGVDPSTLPPPKQRKPKKAKDPNKPKKGLTAYMFYCNDTRAKVRAQNPTMKAKDVMCDLANKWSRLSDEQKKPYEEKAAADALRYKQAMEKYLAAKKEEQDQNDAQEKAQQSRLQAEALKFFKKQQREHQAAKLGKKVLKSQKEAKSE